jgi:ABC-type Mn2+/Zn2+ transport system permease subunit
MWALILPTLCAAFLAGFSGGLLGVLTLSLRLSALGYAMAHAAFAGAALGLWLGIPPLLTAFLFAAFVAALLGPISERTGLPPDTVLALLFPLTMALGFLFIALTPGLPLTSPALAILWGSLLGVGWTDVALLFGVLFATGGFLLLFRREVWAVLVERRLAEEAGIPARPILWTILFLLGAGVAASLRLVGGLLVYALLFFPLPRRPSSSLIFGGNSSFRPFSEGSRAWRGWASPFGRTSRWERQLPSFPAAFSSFRGRQARAAAFL